MTAELKTTPYVHTVKPHRLVLIAFLIVWFTFLVAVVIDTFSGDPNQRPMETSFYVWQQQWGEPVTDAVRRASSKADRLMLFAGEATCRSGQVAIRPTYPDWDFLSSQTLPLTLVVRMGVEFAGPLKEGEKTSEEMARALTALLEKTTVREIPNPEIQIDYDCPTKNLKDYARFIGLIRQRLPQTNLSITTLPTWIGRGGFHALVRDLDYFVLQAHSIETPKTLNQPIQLCDTDKIRPWLRKLKSIKTPYYLALPTYGYRVIFDSNQKFAGLMAERNLSLDLQNGYQERTVMANHSEIAAVVRDLKAERPSQCLGIAWFRLPVATDRLNWSWPALCAVMEGREPESAFRAELRNPSPDLYEVWIHNDGESNISRAVCFQVDLKGAALRAYDLMPGFKEDPTGTRVHGPAPTVNQPILAGWYRLAAPETDTVKSPSIGNVEILK